MTSFPIDARLTVRLHAEAFLADYMHALDADRLEEWPDFFTEGGLYKIVTRENAEQGLPLAVMSCEGRGMLRDRISALRTANIFEPHVYCHIPGAMRVLDVSNSMIETESTFVVFRTMADGAMSLYACGRSRDRLVRDATGLRLSERSIILDSRQIDTLLVIPL